MAGTQAEILIAAGAVMASLVGGGAAAAVITARYQRKQQVRAALLPPAERFSTAVLVAFAQLRTVKPPKPRPRVPGNRAHRNEILLTDRRELERRLAAVNDALDEVRAARGVLRLVFSPESPADRFARMVLAAQRRMMEMAADFYRDCSAEGADPTTAQARHEPKATLVWDALRDYSAWRAFDCFVEEVWRNVRRAEWQEPRGLPAPHAPGEVLALDVDELRKLRSPSPDGSSSGA